MTWWCVTIGMTASVACETILRLERAMVRGRRISTMTVSMSMPMVTAITKAQTSGDGSVGATGIGFGCGGVDMKSSTPDLMMNGKPMTNAHNHSNKVLA